MKEKLPIGPNSEGLLFRFENNTRQHFPHSHDELEFNLALSGQATYLVRGRKYALRPATLLWLFPDDEHVLFDYSPDFSMWVAVFTPALIRSACRQPPQAPLRKKRYNGEISRTLLPDQWRPLTELAEQTIARSDNTDYVNATLRLLLISAWSSFLQAREGARYEQVHPAVNRAAMLLKTHASDAGLAAISRRAGLSEAHLSRLFKQQMGISLTDYRNQQRLRRFAALYDGGRDENLLDAALDSGFGSYAQFHRVFCQHYGHTPAKLKKRHRQVTSVET